jgi:glutathione S-transferase
MSMAKLKVYGRTSSINVRKVLWLCVELGVPVEQEPWGTGFRSTQEAEFLAMNPNGLVPVLRDEGFVLWESNTICRYLAAKHGRTDLLPADWQARARVEQWMDWQATELNSAWRYAFMHWVRRSPSFADPAAAAASAQNWNRHMTLLDAQLARSGAFVAGEVLTLADIVLGLATHRWLMTPIERPALPAVAAYDARLRERAGFVALANADMP